MTAAIHVPAPEDWLFVKTRGDNYKNVCTEGYTTGGLSQIHHVVSCAACQDSNMPTKDRDFVRYVIAHTNCNINNLGNLVGLQKKWAYVNDDRARNTRVRRDGYARAPTWAAEKNKWDKWPCHQIDHPQYLTGIKNHVRKRIFEKIQKMKATQSCESVDKAKVKKDFETASSDWLRKLKLRGKREQGTLKCLEYCMNNQENPAHAKESKWHIPFSMDVTVAHKNVRPRTRPSWGNNVVVRTPLMNLK